MTKHKEAKPSIHSADDLIVKMEAEKLGKPIPETPKIEPNTQQTQESEIEAQDTSQEEEQAPHQEEEEKSKAESQEKTEQEISEEASAEPLNDNEVDEYGTKIGKPKLYTEEEVQSMIRKRLRDRHAEQTPQTQQQVQNAVKDFSPDPESNESWEVQLEQFVEKTIHKLGQKQNEAEWRKNEEQTQAEFEDKFSQGMTKYKDFTQVVSNKPITNAMMLATRSMKDPAAFIYAAAKQHPKELERISQIGDAVTQATEIGRLEERMKKARVIPASPRPSQKITGDSSSEMPQISIEARIAQHAKEKIMSRR